MPVSIDDGRGAAVTLGLVYEQPGVSLAVAGGETVTITPINPVPVDPIYRIAFTPSAALTAIGAATQTRSVVLGAAAATQFMAAVVRARSAQIQAAAEVAAVGGKTDSRLIQFTPSARMDPFIQAANVEARDIRFTPAATLDVRAAQAQARDFAATGQATLQATAGATQGRFIALETAATVQPFIAGAAVAAREIRFTPSAAVNVTGGQIEARLAQPSSLAELQPIGGRIVSRNLVADASAALDMTGSSIEARHALIAAGAATLFVGEDGAVQIITVVSGGVQPGIEPLTDGDNITAGIPTGADTLANYETSAVGETIASVVVTATINGSDVGIISQNTA